MTRTEAIKVVEEAWGRSGRAAVCSINVLEALGLLKFDQEPTSTEKFRRRLLAWGYSSVADDLDALLGGIGCKIVEDK